MNLYQPTLNHRFVAFFTIGLIPDPVSVRFERISGLGHDMQVQQYHEGGYNHVNRYFPQRVTTPNLVFERGVMTVSPLTLAADLILSGFFTSLVSMDILIMLLNQKGVPEATWLATGAMPVRVNMGSLDATSSQTLMNTMEFACRSVEWQGIKL